MGNHSELVIGIDSSTTGCKAIAWDMDGQAIAEGRTRLDISHPRPEWHEQSAEDWWLNLRAALLQVTAQVDARRIAALCIAHQRETFVPVNSEGHPLRNAILWMDERARPLLPRLKEQFGSGRFHQVTGKPLSGNLTIAKIAWLQQHEPEVVRQTARFLDVHAYLVQRLTGDYKTGWGCADPMGLFDMGKNSWAEELLEGIKLETSQFPEAFPPGAVLGEVTTQAAEACGLAPGTLVVAGLGDGQSAGLGANITHNDEAYLSMGTSFISGVFTERYQVDPAFRTMYAGIPGGYFIETVILGGSYTVSWFVENFGNLPSRMESKDLAPEQAWEAAARNISPGAGGLLLVPYWNSVMGPYWDASASGVVVGWRGRHDKAHLYRAVLEGIAFEQWLNTRGVEAALATKIRRFVATGGGAQNDLWRQIVADVTGIPVERAGTPECAALGAGILAASAAGFFRDVRQAAQTMSRLKPGSYEPDPGRHAFYQQVYEEVYVHLYPALQAYLSRLTDLTSRYEQDPLSFPAD